MSVKVIKNKIFDGNKTYEIGEVIEGLSDKDESRLVEDGIVDYIYEKSEVKQDIIIDDTDKKEESLVDSIGEEDEKATDDINKEEDIIEEEEVEAINPDSFAINADEYAKASSTKAKKGKVI